MVSFLYEITKKNTNPIAIITHGGVIRGIISHVLGLELEKSFSIIINFGSISMIERIKSDKNDNKTRFQIKFINKKLD